MLVSELEKKPESTIKKNRIIKSVVMDASFKF